MRSKGASATVFVVSWKVMVVLLLCYRLFAAVGGCCAGFFVFGESEKKHFFNISRKHRYNVS